MLTLQEPQPATAPLQRTSGEGRVRVAVTDGVARLVDLHQQGAAKVRFPRRSPGQTAEAVLINTAGGLTGGDEMSWTAAAGADAGLVVTTQACEKIYKSVGGDARVTTRLSAGDGGFLAWLPQETILFNEARLDRRLDVDIEGSAKALLMEAVVFGRRASGEACATGSFRDRWQVRCDGRLVHREDAVFEGGIDNLLGHKAVADGNMALATLLLVGPDVGDLVVPLRRALVDIGTVVSGASAWTVGRTGKLLARMQAKDSYELRKALVCTISVLNQGAPLPKVWSI